MWGASAAAPNMYAMPGMVPPGPMFGFQQPAGYGGHPMPPNAWGQMNPQSVPPLSPPHIFCQPPAAGPGSGQTNPFLGGAFPAMGDQQGPQRPAPRASAKEAPLRAVPSHLWTLLATKGRRLARTCSRTSSWPSRPPSRRGKGRPPPTPPRLLATTRRSTSTSPVKWAWHRIPQTTTTLTSTRCLLSTVNPLPS